MGDLSGMQKPGKEFKDKEQVYSQASVIFFKSLMILYFRKLLNPWQTGRNRIKLMLLRNLLSWREFMLKRNPINKTSSIFNTQSASTDSSWGTVLPREIIGRNGQMPSVVLHFLLNIKEVKLGKNTFKWDGCGPTQAFLE